MMSVLVLGELCLRGFESFVKLVLLEYAVDSVFDKPVDSFLGRGDLAA